MVRKGQLATQTVVDSKFTEVTFWRHDICTWLTQTNGFLWKVARVRTRKNILFEHRFPEHTCIVRSRGWIDCHYVGRKLHLLTYSHRIPPSCLVSSTIALSAVAAQLCPPPKCLQGPPNGDFE